VSRKELAKVQEIKKNGKALFDKLRETCGEEILSSAHDISLLHSVEVKRMQ